ncbi:ribonuclease Y [Negativicoccus succinicivorans]|uniref:ribonuclease Y n=1 Tax=Negativicoccus succinicivorans TaxID=620903 RepID=UPI0029054495|nr:ribonuclease Y [Negativicoccus succinicivorans]MDU2417719.1 ribonuclease Y [Negativicoccus succinicivorans]
MIGLLLAIIGVACGYFLRRSLAESKIGSAEQEASRIVAQARRDADSTYKESVLQTKDEMHRLRTDFEQEEKERRTDLQRYERRLLQKEENLEKRADSLEHKEEALQRRDAKVKERQSAADSLYAQQLQKLEEISGLTTEQAKALLLEQTETQIKHDQAVLIRELQTQFQAEADKNAREVISLAIQRNAADQVAETTISVVSLPNDEMKGRIIGREGRNIRALEMATGVDLIIDDTPEAVTLSGFHSIRREVARIALENLIKDGRIHPARIEETVEKAKREVDKAMREAGEQATFDVGIHDLHPELIKILGRLKYRTSYGQNVLQHSVEVAMLAGTLAAEIGADVGMARRAGLLHDIGKAIDQETEGTHVELGVEIAKKYHEPDVVVNAIGSHHGDTEATFVEAVLVAAADAISAARPGARRETLENYLKRLTKLEEIAKSFDGVESCFAIQAGREIRVMVKPEKVNEDEATLLVHKIATRIENELKYPGQVKVVVIRETRATDYAK